MGQGKSKTSAGLSVLSLGVRLSHIALCSRVAASSPCTTVLLPIAGDLHLS